MQNEEQDQIEPFIDLALRYGPSEMQQFARIAFSLDARLGRMLARSSEPLLVQMRYAWWRDQLGMSPEERPRGDPVLDAIGQHWRGEETALVALIDGWEARIGGVESAELRAVLDGYARTFAAIAALCDASQQQEAALNGRWFALGTLVSGPGEETFLKDILARATDLGSRPRLRGKLRPLGILGGLAERAIARRTGPLFGDRLSALAMMRLGLTG